MPEFIWIYFLVHDLCLIWQNSWTIFKLLSNFWKVSQQSKNCFTALAYHIQVHISYPSIQVHITLTLTQLNLDIFPSNLPDLPEHLHGSPTCFYDHVSSLKWQEKWLLVTTKGKFVLDSLKWQEQWLLVTTKGKFVLDIYTVGSVFGVLN